MALSRVVATIYWLVWGGIEKEIFFETLRPETLGTFWYNFKYVLLSSPLKSHIVSKYHKDEKFDKILLYSIQDMGGTFEKKSNLSLH